MRRTPETLARAAELAGGVRLVGVESVRLADGSRTIVGRFEFDDDDPWAAARLLAVLAHEEAEDPDPLVYGWARAILAAVEDERGPGASDAEIADAFAEAAHANVKARIRFVPEEGEQFQSARTTLINGEGDCDCHATLVYVLAHSAGLGAVLRFTEQDGEPTHVCTALYTSDGPQWAETTIDARFGEDPHDALARLGGAAGDRTDIGFLGLDFVSAADVRSRKRELDAAVSSLDSDVQRCAGLGADTLASWATFREAWRSFFEEDPSWYSAGGQGRQAADYAERIRDWQQRVGSACTLSAPLVPEAPADQTVSLVKTVVVGMAIVAAAGVGVEIARRLPTPRRAAAAE